MASRQELELYFLIVKFLQEGVCPEAAKLLEEKLNKECSSQIPSRLDWEGNLHDQTIEDLKRQYPSVNSKHLAILCCLGTNRNSLLSPPLPRQPPPRIWQPPGILSHRQITGFQHSPSVYTMLYKRLQLLRRNLGHISPVFCLLFDKTGQVVFTGSDDFLVKMWSIRNGMLIYTFRGASSEVSDIAISPDNKMIAAGTVDKKVLVWCLSTAAPVAVLSKHTGPIIALHFCPAALPGIPSYLLATSSQGLVSFWSFSYDNEPRNRASFDREPVTFCEKTRRGSCDILCASFSAGGTFLATGSEDQHVRVYMMDSKEGPVKILDNEVHLQRVDSIQWCNTPNIQFLSGSKDGTAKLFSFAADNWNIVELNPTKNNVQEDMKLTMVKWNSNDSKVITAISDFSLCVWDPISAIMVASLKGHQGLVYVLEPHPTRPEFLMSAGHDGNLILWDITSNEILFQYSNKIENQGYGAIYDAKWAPDGLNVAASDSNGHVLFFGMNSTETYDVCPKQMFFHTDYRPLIQDSNNYIVDEQTQCAPHLLPPGFLVDVDGNLYPPHIQELVPGRKQNGDKKIFLPCLIGTESVEEEPTKIAVSIIDELISELFVASDCLVSEGLTNQITGIAFNKASQKFEGQNWMERIELGLQERHSYMIDSAKKQGLDSLKELDELVKSRTRRGKSEVLTQAGERSTPSLESPPTKRKKNEVENSTEIKADEEESNESRKSSKQLPYICPYCGHSYSKKSLVVKHMDTCPLQ